MNERTPIMTHEGNHSEKPNKITQHIFYKISDNQDVFIVKINAQRLIKENTIVFVSYSFTSFQQYN